jgi:hypothetical protein
LYFRERLNKECQLAVIYIYKVGSVPKKKFGRLYRSNNTGPIVTS